MVESLQKWVNENEGKPFAEMSPFPEGYAYLIYPNGLVISSKDALNEQIRAIVAEEKVMMERY